MACPFCSLDPSRIILENDHAMAIKDAYPVTAGHTLIIPKRHFASFFEANSDDQASLFNLLTEMRKVLIEELSPDGFNIGINDGTAAGQTVMHLHLHLIPRFNGDIEDPRGGVRWIMPDKAPYWRNL